MRELKPSVRIKSNPLSESVQTGETAIMDDTVYTMDDSRVFMGGQVTIYSSIKAKIKTPKVFSRIKRRR